MILRHIYLALYVICSYASYIFGIRPLCVRHIFAMCLLLLCLYSTVYVSCIAIDLS